MTSTVDPVTVLMEFYKENTTQGRQLESQRQFVTAIFLTLAGAILAAIATLKLTIGSLPLALMLLPLGWYGRKFTQKYWERFEYHMEYARRVRKQIDILCPDAGLESIRMEARKTHDKDPRFQALRRMRVYKKWAEMHGFVIALGVIASFLILVNYWHYLKYGVYLFI